MRKNSSYLDSLNDGRQKRSRTSLDDLDRTLRSLEEKIGGGSGIRRSEPGASRDFEDKFRNLASDRTNSSRHHREPQVAERMPSSSSFKNLAQDIELARIQEKNVAAVEVIATELKNLRSELQTNTSAGLQRELEALRSDLAENNRLARMGSPGKELSDDIARLSDNMRALAQRSDDSGINVLRLEFEEVKRALGSLAREESIQQINDRWMDLDRRWDPANSGAKSDFVAEPEFQSLAARLEDISQAVNSLPNSLSLNSVEDKLRVLATAVDQLSQNHDPVAPQSIEMIEQRLDEISRAIVASSVSVQAAVPNTEQFERIEARISSLARQIEELSDTQSPSGLMEQINSLTERVELLTREAGSAPDAVDNLAAQIAALSEKMETAEQASGSDPLLRELEQRYEKLVETLQRQHDATEQQGQALMRDLEARLDSVANSGGLGGSPVVEDQDSIIRTIDARFNQLAQQFDERVTREPGDETIRNLEARLSEISTRLEQTGSGTKGIDTDLIQSLESQISGLTQHLERPDAVLPEHEDVIPRIKQMEELLAGNREQIVEAAREAAERAIQSLPAGTADGPSVLALADDLKSLESLARNSDERNARTFEAIHDTLLKIVERLGSLESGSAVRDTGSTPNAAPATPPKLFDEHQTPPIETEQSEADFENEIVADGLRSASAGKKSMLGGLARALKGKTSHQPVESMPETAEDGYYEGDTLLNPAVEPDLPDDNAPLAPGSGAPDLGSIMARVKEDKHGEPGDGNSDTAKSDFIAAARRAAQAAAAEAETQRERTERGGNGGRFKAVEILQQKRKPILIGASVLLIALAGVQLTSAFLGGEKTTMVADAPAVQKLEQSAAEAPEEKTASEPAETAEAEPAVRVVQPEEAAAVVPVPDDAGASEQPGPEMAAEIVTAPQPEEPPTVTPAPTVKVEAIPVDAGPVALREAAQAGDAKALHEVGTRYAEGRGVTTDLKAAAKWYQIAADLGFAPAQYRIGNFYEKGLGIERDLAKAMTWYQLAAEQGNASAMHNLAVLFAMGGNGQPDNESAARWFERAAELGVKDSQFNLGILSAKGVGTQQNLEDSYKWFALAAKTGDKDAASKRDEIANALRPEQLATARAAVDLWKAKPLAEDANVVTVPAAWKEDKGTTAGIDVDVKKAVKNIQLILNKNGYDAGPADGVMGAKTKSAIAAFQKDNGMAATGEVDETLVKALLARND